MHRISIALLFLLVFVAGAVSVAISTPSIRVKAEESQNRCRVELVQADEGYGVSHTVQRQICR